MHLPYPVSFFRWFLLVVLFVPSIGRAEEPNQFSAVQAVFQKHCMDCHEAKDPEANLVLENFETLMKGGESGAAVIAGKSAESLLVKMVEGKIERDGKKLIMPPGKSKKLDLAEIEVIKAWIDAG
ncbi:MAG: c-type cytochrome domain-containing protein, partial [Verrucomicrobiota bacterium]